MKNNIGYLFEKYYEEYKNAPDKEKVFNELFLNQDVKDFLLMLVNKYLLNYHNLRPYKQDFYQDALISLTNSFENFDQSLNVPLFSYIINNINYAFLNEVDDLSDIKRSKGVTQNLRLLAKLLKDNPNNEEYVRKAFKEETDIEKDSTVDSYFEMLNSGKNTLSLDNNGNDSSSSYLDYVESDSLNPLELLLDESKQEILDNHLKEDLNFREYDYLTRNIGWHRKSETMQEIANNENVSKQYVSKVVSQAKEKLKKSSLIEELKKYR